MAVIRRSFAELRILQTTVRAAHPMDERPVASRRIPADLARAEFKSMSFFRDGVEALELAVAAVKADLTLEHLHKPDNEVWRFTMAASLDKVSSFIETHDRPVLQDTCFFPVLQLKAVATEDPRVPKSLITAPLDPEARSFAMIQIAGTTLEPCHYAHDPWESTNCAVRLLVLALTPQGWVQNAAEQRG